RAAVWVASSARSARSARRGRMGGSGEAGPGCCMGTTRHLTAGGRSVRLYTSRPRAAFPAAMPRLVLLTVVCVLASAGPARCDPAGDELFEKHVRPVLVERCLSCHGPEKPKGGLRLDTREAVLKGGDSGPAAVPGKPAESRMIAAVRQTGELKMPPDAKLPEPTVRA